MAARAGTQHAGLTAGPVLTYFRVNRPGQSDSETSSQYNNEGIAFAGKDTDTWSRNSGAGPAIVKKATALVASVFLTAVLVGGCSSQPISIVGDNAALCEYSAQSNGGEVVSRCRVRLGGQQRRLPANNAIRIDGYTLLNTPEQPSAVADQCKTAPKIAPTLPVRFPLNENVESV